MPAFPVRLHIHRAAKAAEGGADGGIIQGVGKPLVIINSVPVVGQVFQQGLCQSFGWCGTAVDILCCSGYTDF